MRALSIAIEMLIDEINLMQEKKTTAKSLDEKTKQVKKINRAVNKRDKQFLKLCDEIENEDIAPDVAMELMNKLLEAQRKAQVQDASRK